MNTLMSLIKELISQVWDYIQRIWQKVINFAKNIFSFFSNPNRLKKIQENKDLVAVAIKENLESGNFTVINCLFDKEKETIEDALIVEGETIDAELNNKFANKDMIILN